MAVCRVAEGVGHAVPHRPALAPTGEETRGRLVRSPSSVPPPQAHRASVADEEPERNDDEPHRKGRGRRAAGPPGATPPPPAPAVPGGRSRSRRANTIPWIPSTPSPRANAT